MKSHLTTTSVLVVQSFWSCVQSAADTAVLCTKFQDDWIIGPEIMDERDFARFEFEIRFGRTSYIAHHPLSPFWPQFYQTRKCSAVHNFAPTVTKFCVMGEGLSLPHDTKFGNCRDEIADRRVIFIWSLIHGSSWSGLIKVGPGNSAWFFGMNRYPHSLFFVGCNQSSVPATAVKLNCCWG